MACYQNLPEPDVSTKRDKRLLIAIAGPPGSGKGRIARKVARAINPSIGCSVISCDGWCHNPHKDLDSLVPKSPPWTFTGAATVDLVEQVRNQTAESKRITSPFSPHAEDSNETSLNMACDAPIVIFEGLYLLCEDLPWARIRNLVDERWFVEIEPALAKEHVTRRFVESGVEPDYERACERYDENDVFNAEFVNRTSKERDVTIRSVDRRTSMDSTY